MSDPKIARPCEYTVTILDGITALHSGRPLYHVVCDTCGVIVHPGTTSADAQQKFHERDLAEDRPIDLFGHTRNENVIRKPQHVAFKPERVFVSAKRMGELSPKAVQEAWIINDITIGNRSMISKWWHVRLWNRTIGRFWNRITRRFRKPPYVAYTTYGPVMNFEISLRDRDASPVEVIVSGKSS